MADHTAAEQLAAIDIVAGLLDTGGTHNARVSASLSTIRRRVEQRLEHDYAIGAAFSVQTAEVSTAAEIGALIRAAVESTGAIITEPPVVAGVAIEEEDHRD